MIRFTLRALSMSDVEPASVLRDLNRAMLAAGAAGADGERFCTVIFGVLTPTPTGAVLTLAGGGHPHPVVRRADGGIEEIAVGGSLLGVLPDVPVGTRTVTLDRGDALVLYTDGAVEARRDGVMFGDERLADAVRAAPTGGPGAGRRGRGGGGHPRGRDHDRRPRRAGGARPGLTGGRP